MTRIDELRELYAVDGISLLDLERQTAKAVKRADRRPVARRRRFPYRLVLDGALVLSATAAGALTFTNWQANHRKPHANVWVTPNNVCCSNDGIDLMGAYNQAHAGDVITLKAGTYNVQNNYCPIIITNNVMGGACDVGSSERP